MELSWQYFRFYHCSNRTLALWLPVIVRGVVFSALSLAGVSATSRILRQISFGLGPA
jgi:hypothetical protein